MSVLDQEFKNQIWDKLNGLSNKTLTENMERSPDEIVPVPKIPFEVFFKKFNTIKEVTETDEWKDTYCYYYEFNENELTINIHETKEDHENYDLERIKEEYYLCATDFFYFCTKYIKIIHPTQGIIPFIAFKYQRRVVDAYENNRFVILSKFRQGGLTTISVLYALWKCMFTKAQKILTLSKSQREATGAGDNVKVAMEHMPEWLKPTLGEDAKMEKKFVDTSSYLWFYTPEAARGKSASFIIIDEAAFIPDMDERWRAMYPTISTGGKAIVISTNGSKQDWYGRTYHDALDKKNKFKIVEMDYWEHPLYSSQEWVEETKVNIGEEGWLREVLRCFLGSGKTYFNPDIIEKTERSTRKREPYRIAFNKFANQSKTKLISWEDGALWFWKEPIEGREYIVSADCAEGMGEESDNNSFQVLDLKTMEQVAEFYSNNIPPHIFAQVIKQIGDYYNTATVVVEHMSTGQTVLSYLENDYFYENLYQEPGQKYYGIKTNKNNRTEILQSLKRRLINGSIKINSIRLANEMSTFIIKGQRPEAQSGFHDDAILSLSLATYVIDVSRKYTPIGAEDSTDELNSITDKAIIDEIRNEISPEDFDFEWDDGEYEDDIYQSSNDFEVLSNKIKLNKILKEFNL